MKKFIIGLLVVAVLGVGGYYAYTTFFTSEEAPKQEFHCVLQKDFMYLIIG
jgi:hypothetical protein